MGSSIASLGVGIYADTKNFVRPVHESIGITKDWSQTMSGVLVPAANMANQAGQDAAEGLGSLSSLMELVELRTMATSASISKLAKVTQQIGKQPRGAAKAAKEYDAQERSINSLIRAQKKLLGPIRAPSSMRLVDFPEEMSSVTKLFSEIDRLEQARAARRQSLRQGLEPTSLRLERANAELADPSTNLFRRREIESEINTIMSERLRISMSLANPGTGELELIRARQQKISQILAQRPSLLEQEIAKHRESLALVEKQHQLQRSPASLSRMKSEFEQVTQEIEKQVREEKRLNQSMIYSADNEGRIASLSEQANEAKRKRNALETQQKGLKRDILNAQERGLAVEGSVVNILEKKRASLSKEASLRYQVRKEEEEFISSLREAVRLEQIGNDEAREMLTTFRQLSTQQMANLNRGVEQSNRGFGRMGFAVQNLGYGIEDAVSQFGTRGLAGAIGAASNNVSAMSSAFGSIKLQLGASLGVSVLQLLAQTGALQKGMEALGLAEEDMTERNESLSRSYENLARAQREALDNQQSLNSIMAEDSSAALKGRITSLKDEMARLRIEQERSLKEYQKEQDLARIDSLDQEIERLRTRGAILEGNRAAREEAQMDESQVLKDIAENRRAIAASLKARTELNDKLNRQVEKRSEAEVRLAEAGTKILNVEQQLAAAAERRTSRLQFDLKTNLELARTREAMLFRDESSAANLQRAEQERSRLQRERLDLAMNPGNSLDAQVENSAKLAELEGKRLTNQRKLNDLMKEGQASERSALSSIQQMGASISKNYKQALDLNTAQQEFNSDLKKALDLKAIDQERADQLSSVFSDLNEKQKLKNDLEKRSADLKRQLDSRTAATLQNSVESNSVEAARIVSQAVLGAKQQRENQPLVDELQKVQSDLKDIITAVEDIPTLALKGID